LALAQVGKAAMGGSRSTITSTGNAVVSVGDEGS
jgi:hypothetical protein